MPMLWTMPRNVTSCEDSLLADLFFVIISYTRDPL